MHTTTKDNPASLLLSRNPHTRFDLLLKPNVRLILQNNQEKQTKKGRIFTKEFESGEKV